ncbi:DNA helicase mcm9 [Cichlidogyrus casuarinus]|uniref:DNA helicase n=1 Tax=Cichlidogyrus casuarinus TaxID=1844966 RepID=A0ABD2QG95_9PLAT
MELSDSDIPSVIIEFVKVEENKSTLSSSLKRFLSDKYHEELLKIKESKETAVFLLNYSKFTETSKDPMLYDMLLHYVPEYMLELLSSTSKEALLEICSKANPKALIVRLTDLPHHTEIQRTSIPSNSDADRMIAFRCNIIRAGPVQVIRAHKNFYCPTCNFVFPARSNFHMFNSIVPPLSCPNPTQICSNTCFKEPEDSSMAVRNYQELRVSEQIHCLTVGVMPRTILVCLEDDLVDSAQPGDDIIVHGIVCRRWHPPKVGQPCQIDIVIRANYIENLTRSHGMNSSKVMPDTIEEFRQYWKNSKNALEARNHLVANIFPSLCGLYLPKLALALLLAGAPASNSDILRRGCSHLLLIGDPGVAKSVLLRSVVAISNKAVMTSATESTAAGLTAAAIRDGGNWALEAGALVLADTGICAIDEFTQLNSNENAAVHEAMEQQTITISKAGLHARLNARCSVVAAANPPSRVNSESGLGIKAPLLSRFDLIFRLQDPTKQEEWDGKVADFVLGEEVEKETECDRSSWTRVRLKQYFSWIRSEFEPVMTDECSTLLQTYYCWLRGKNSLVLNSFGRLTPRLLESLTRLTLSHARLMARNQCLLMDAVTAVMLMDASMQSLESTGDDGDENLNINQFLVLNDFPDKPQTDLDNATKCLFEKLQIMESEDACFRIELTVPIENESDSREKDEESKENKVAIEENKKEVDLFDFESAFHDLDEALL